MAYHDKILMLQPNWNGFGIDLRALWQRFTKKTPKPWFDTVVVAQHFLQIFEDHAVPIAHIPRIIPGLTLENLRNPESLLPVLKIEMLQQATNLFKVEMAWLEGHSDQMYYPRSSYKHPKDFLKEAMPVLEEEEEGRVFPVIAFRSTETLNGKGKRGQLVVVVFVEKCLAIDHNDIYRYIINDSFDWAYWKCRIQLKAMVRVLEQQYDVSIPIYLVSDETLQALESGYMVPRKAMRESRNRDRLFLEDYALGPDEHPHAKESEELEAVKEYVEAFALEDENSQGTNNRSRFL